MKDKISYLLGAGFSEPMGYPLGSVLNSKILECNKEPFRFESGSLVLRNNGAETMPKSSEFLFLFEVIHHYKRTKSEFDYEDFFDFINGDLKENKIIKEIASPFINEKNDINDLLSKIKIMFVQIVSYFIKDRNGEHNYENSASHIGKQFNGYSGILRYIGEQTKNYIVNIHTLNHDLLFERFDNTDFFEQPLSDGFEEFGSSYYGLLNCENRGYFVRLSRYTGEYKSTFRLYKLHGSLNYEAFYKKNDNIYNPEIYLKTKYKIGHTNLYKEVLNDNGQFEYQNSWFNYHSDFLTGTTSKIKKYKTPLLYKKLFDLFKNNLQNSDKLIIIGYGARDTEINKIIIENFNYNNKRTYIIDPFPNDNLKHFAKQINAKIINTKLENISNEDFE